ncbi:MAG: tripartite tricarboxylate transporter permease [Candidatus Micrarchaeota archaeon]|nr:tripartite tricarboxylate transporter permease [Candidatus Micrarchaeota archaeon]
MNQILALLIGLGLGIFCGVLPGLHPNSVASIISNIEMQNIGIILISMLGVYSVILFLPSIMFGIPEGESLISLLPGQKMYIEGKLKEAIYIVSVASLISGLIAFFLGFMMIFVFRELNNFIKPYLAYILIFASVFFILKQERKIYAFIIFLICALWGYVVFDKNISEPLFAMFVGFFTIPAIIYMQKDKKIEQKKEIENNKIDFFLHIVVGIIFGAIADFLPGISSPAQLALLSSIFLKTEDVRKFLAHLVSIEVSHNIIAISTATGSVARVGVVAIAKKFVEISPVTYSIYATIFLFSLLVGVYFLEILATNLQRKIQTIDFSKILKILLIYLTSMIGLISGIEGLVILVVSSIFGIIVYKFGINRITLMASLIGPSIIHLMS